MMSASRSNDLPPFNDAELARIARHLGLDPCDEQLHDFVEVAREYKENMEFAPLIRTHERKQALDKRKLAGKASTLLGELTRLYRTEPALREAVREFGLHHHVGEFLESEQTAAVGDLLHGFSIRPLKAGRKKDIDLTIMLVFLIVAWRSITGKENVSRAYIRDCLDPLGCDLSEYRLEERITEARVKVTELEMLRDDAPVRSSGETHS